MVRSDVLVTDTLLSTMPEQRFDQSPSLLQQQTIAPQMQQSLQLLQAPTLELRQMVHQELVQNPTLEEEFSDISFEEVAMGSEEEDFEREFAELSQLDEEWHTYLSQARLATPRHHDLEERHQFMMDSLVEPITLQEHLQHQLSLTEIEAGVREAATLLIGNLSENGFLPTSLEKLSLEAEIPLEVLEEAKFLVQSFDPVGVGAVDLRDCLLIQLERLGKHHSLEYRIVDHFLDELARKHYPQIAKKLSVTPEQITLAAEFIATLDPRPGNRFGQETNLYITPDVVVERVGTEWVVSMNNEQIPRLKISNAYKDLMVTGDGSELRSYIREKIRAGRFLIKSIHQRQETIHAIATEIVARQSDFLEHGTARLKPMNMVQIAEKVGVHETTVSRAVSGKYIATPHGVFEMKYFFTSGYQTESGEALSNTSVKQAIAEMIEAEEAKNPLSDQRLVEALEERGIKIARRTVAKYREELNILPSHMRRSY